MHFFNVIRSFYSRAPRSTVLIVVFLAPVVEEALFRGYVFGNLREYSRGAAYLVSCLVFALIHVWPFFAESWDVGHTASPFTAQCSRTLPHRLPDFS